ncbi:CinA family protein [Natronospira bacteriovora]|uniref:Nicotinamide-nucleotide amidohydrolase family protein n=1 Tax=Natronospira bacteriovora TaxID=3069753 RepID=A0ABU0WAE3_9GAMM|nr:nicotinamide-nucleotide amidohydrolase family protein [Natronospira sp. AB-CW4]MDQ2070435.1 nicotinamide-nucleotide amidohydrolase family protein [Natronospira sp. AB-CW4]
MTTIKPPTDEQLFAQAQHLGTALLARQASVTVAESCTGGWLGKCLTDVAGSSEWFQRGWITYSNAAKAEELGVDTAMLETHGAVSEEVVSAMAIGARLRAGADIALAVSGVAGPGGGSRDKPVGLVCFALADGAGTLRRESRQFSGDREAVRRASVAHALGMALEWLGGLE